MFDGRRRFAAVGLWDPVSPIRVRILHAGKPTRIDHGFWHDRVEEAVGRRAALDATGTTGYRLVHGENDGMGGLVVDRFDRTLVVKLYTTAWLYHLDSIITSLFETVVADRLVVRLARTIAHSHDIVTAGVHDGQVVVGSTPPEQVPFTELGLRFGADVQRGQKTGWFLDQRENRRRVAERSAGCRVLDVFSSAGGFSVHAAAAGAELVHSVDLSPHAIEAARRNMDRNRAEVERCEHRVTVGDAFDVMADLVTAGERYDVVVVDPPAFARAAAHRPRALRGYRRLASLGMELTESDGLYVQASCSTQVGAEDLHTIVHAAARDRGRRILASESTGAGIDHPVTFPQGRYLDAVFARFG